MSSVAGKKTVYIDPPLLKKELTMREKNHLFHEESMKLAFNKKDPKPVFFLMTGQRSPEKQPQPKVGHFVCVFVCACIWVSLENTFTSDFN